jgi:hypothetical protein
LGVDFTSDSVAAQTSGESGGRRRRGEADEVDPASKEADRAETASTPLRPRKKSEEVGRLHGVPAVDKAAPRRSTSKVKEQRWRPLGEDATAMHTNSTPPPVSHVARGRRRAQSGRKEK